MSLSSCASNPRHGIPFSATVVLAGSLDKACERVAILGSNGAGKSSLMAAITGLLVPRGGRLDFIEQSLAGLKLYQITQLGIALVPEGRRVYRDMTVRENLEMAAFPKRGRPILKQTMRRVFDLFPKLQERTHQQYSGLPIGCGRSGSHTRCDFSWPGGPPPLAS